MKDNEKKNQDTELTDEKLANVAAGMCSIDSTSKKNTEAPGTHEEGNSL